MKKKDIKKVKDENEEKKIVFYTHEIKKSKTINEDTVKVISFIIILLIVSGLFALLFFINGKYVTKDKYQDETTTTTTITKEPTININQLIVDNMFGLEKKKTYYVLAYDSTDELNGSYLYSLASSADIKDINVYTLDLTNAMNKKYYNKDKEANTKPSKASDVSINTNTLIVFKKGKVAEYITDKDKIIEKLKQK